MVGFVICANLGVAADAGRPPQPFSVALGPARLHCAFGTYPVKQLGKFLLVLGAALTVHGVVQWMGATREPGTADGEGGTDGWYLAVVERAWWTILVGVVLVVTSIYCLRRPRRNV